MSPAVNSVDLPQVGAVLSATVGQGRFEIVQAGRTLPDASAIPAIPVRDVTHDSREVSKGTLFACLRGERHDGHDYATAATAAGAVGLLTDRRLDSADIGDVVQFVVDDARLRLGPVAAEVAGHPSRDLRTVGITGTNGKTTTAQMIATVLDGTGDTAGVVGTLHGSRTTPEAPELQRTLASFVDEGMTAAVMEVSSHALALHRVDGTEFDAVVFTNFGHDHLDLHGSTEAYFRAKASLFTRAFAPLAVINVDDAHGQLLADAIADDGDRSLEVVPIRASDASAVRVQADRVDFEWRGHRVRVPIGGAFNVDNAVAALSTAAAIGIEEAAAVAAIGSLPPVPGRFELVHSPAAAARGVSVVVDYAHTPDGLDGLLRAARPLVTSGGSLRVVFGCGGERDRGKRPEMGAVAVRLADDVVVTSDNPRCEDPDEIIDDVIAGMHDGDGARVERERDRHDAIQRVIERAAGGDVVVIAGKGHERTQDLGDRTVEFDDRAVAREVLEALG